MKLTAVALVLIVGAAVVLVFGNMSNSLVLGGLIGGLAALLLSIPISLTLFTYFSRRHDERLRAEAQEEILAQLEEEAVAVYEDENQLIEAQPAWQEEAAPQRRSPSRQLATPNYPPLPAAGQSHAHTPGNLPARQHSTSMVPLSRQYPGMRDKDAPTRRPAANRGSNNPGTSTGSLRAQAYRAAQQEAVQQQRDNLPTTTSRRMPAARPSSSIPDQPPRLSRQTPQQRPAQQNGLRRGIDSMPTQSPQRRSLAGRNEQTAHQMTNGTSGRARESETEHLGRRQATGSVHQPQTGQIGRHPHLENQTQHSDIETEPLRNSLLRRAPYMYEDDPLRQQLAQQIETPAVRRSSRYLDPQQHYNEE